MHDIIVTVVEILRDRFTHVRRGEKTSLQMHEAKYIQLSQVISRPYLQKFKNEAIPSSNPDHGHLYSKQNEDKPLYILYSRCEISVRDANLQPCSS